MPEFNLSTFKNNVKACVIKAAVIPAFILISTTASATVIEFHSGVELSGTSSTAFIDKNISDYETDLLNAVRQTYGRQAPEGFSFKYSRDFFNPNATTYRGRQIILDGEFTSKFAASFENENSRDTFTQQVDEKIPLGTLTKYMLAGSSLLSHIDIEVEDEAEQGRSQDVDFYDNLFINDAYSNFYLDLSFDFLTQSMSFDNSQLNDPLNEALFSFYLNSNLLTSLIAVEHDFSFSAAPESATPYTGSGSRRLWFADEGSANSALDFFNNDITYLDGSNDGWFQENLLKNNLPADFEFSNVQSQVLSADSWADGAVDVPEPSTLAIFSLGLLGLMSRRFRSK